MPNWVRNRVIAKDFAELKKHLVNEKGEVDFNVAIPMSQDLHITSGSYSYDQQHTSWFSEFTAERIKKQAPADVLMAQHYNNTITQEEFVTECLLDKELVATIRKIKGYKLRGENKMSKENLKEALDTFLKGYFNVQRYGWKDWYDWSIDNWGTKWNSCNTQSPSAKDIEKEELTEIEIWTETAWSPATPVYRKLQQMYPELGIEVLYGDEGGFYVGRLQENGTDLQYSDYFAPEPIEICDEIGMEYLYMEEDGEGEEELC